jgi:hypothetical protein
MGFVTARRNFVSAEEQLAAEAEGEGMAVFA